MTKEQESTLARAAALKAGQCVLNGTGDGTYSEAEDAIRLLVGSLQASAAPDVKLQWPEKLTAGLRAILGLMCFELGGYAHIYRKAGEFVDAEGNDLRKRAEDEQAFMLHKLVGFWLKHGDEWTKAAQADLDRVRALPEVRP